jgi:hypothetical protein
MTTHDIDECLAGLLDATAGAEASFHVAAGEVRSEEARLLLLDRAQRYGRAAARLRAAAPAPAKPPRETPAPPRIGPADEAHILGECERRECAVVVAYRDALERALPQDVRALVAGEFESLLGSLGSLRAARERAARQRRFAVGEPV